MCEMKQLKYCDFFQIPFWFWIAWASAFAKIFVSDFSTRNFVARPCFTISKLRYVSLKYNLARVLWYLSIPRVWISSVWFSNCFKKDFASSNPGLDFSGVFMFASLILPFSEAVRVSPSITSVMRTVFLSGVLRIFRK